MTEPQVEPSKWTEIVREDPTHSHRYVERFRTMEAEGRDLAGEARLIDALAPRAARVLDAGCGPGRVGAFLHSLGHTVVGVDVDPVLIVAANADHPGPTWIVADLAELSLAPDVAGDGFDVIVSAGNVVTFLAPSTRRAVLTNLRHSLRPEGRLVIGFGAGRDYPFDEFFEDVNAVGLTVDVRLSSWDGRPYDATSEFLVAILS
ncbi:MAG: class I SAM-dependent methyltransferase [Ilumatobacter sp.]|nr:class I SAM-dependent methyltransferase [Ilumatobacter sp.]MDG1784455.1 class I SAM-dependent methyltransferase [Ilumatobacter sp.]